MWSKPWSRLQSPSQSLPTSSPTCRSYLTGEPKWFTPWVVPLCPCNWCVGVEPPLHSRDLRISPRIGMVVMWRSDLLGALLWLSCKDPSRGTWSNLLLVQAMVVKQRWFPGDHPNLFFILFFCLSCFFSLKFDVCFYGFLWYVF